MIWKPMVKGVMIAIVAGILELGGIADVDWWCFIVAMNVMVNI